jgi:TetR/AcrR family transcriptional repressor of nem operon
MGRSSSARTRLVASASRRIHASSYAAASVEDLCTDAGVHKGSFYYFFPSKRDLALAAIDDQWTKTVTTILEPAFAPDIEPLERIARFFHSVANQQRARVVRGCPFGNLAAELGTQDKVIRARVKQVFDGYEAYFEAALRDAEMSGNLRGVDVPSAARALLAYLQGVLLLAKTSNDASIIDALADQALNLVSVRQLEST